MVSATSTEQIKQDFNNFIRKYRAGNCYIGITSDIDRRFKEHNLIDDNYHSKDSRIDWLWRKAMSEHEARNIETFYKNEYRDIISGGTGGGNNPTYIYIYITVPEVTSEST